MSHNKVWEFLVGWSRVQCTRRANPAHGVNNNIMEDYNLELWTHEIRKLDLCVPYRDVFCDKDHWMRYGHNPRVIPSLITHKYVEECYQIPTRNHELK